jgi:hypothetical protein
MKKTRDESSREDNGKEFDLFKRIVKCKPGVGTKVCGAGSGNVRGIDVVRIAKARNKNNALSF